MAATQNHEENLPGENHPLLLYADSDDIEVPPVVQETEVSTKDKSFAQPTSPQLFDDVDGPSLRLKPNVDALFDMIRNKQTEEFANAVYRSRGLALSIWSRTEERTEMTTLQFSVHCRAFDITALLLEWARGREDLYLKERYDVDDECATYCTTFLHLLIDERHVELVEKFFNVFPFNSTMRTYLELKKECRFKMTEAKDEVYTVKYMRCFEYAAFVGAVKIVNIFAKYCIEMMQPDAVCNDMMCCVIYGCWPKDCYLDLFCELRNINESCYSKENLLSTLECAIMCGYSEAFAYLFDELKRSDEVFLHHNLSSLLEQSIRQKRESMAIFLFTNGIPLTNVSPNMIQLAIREGLVTLMEYFFPDDEVMGNEGNSLAGILSHVGADNRLMLSLDAAVSYGHVEIARKLLKIVIYRNICVSETVWKNVVKQNSTFCWSFLSAVAQLCKDSEGENKEWERIFGITEGRLSILHIAAMHNHEEFFEWCPVDVDVKDHDGNSPLHHIAANNSADVAEYLYSAEVNVTNKRDQTPLHVACQNNHLKIIRWLLRDNDADLTLADEESNTVLHCYADGLRKVSKNSLKHKHFDVLALLCKKFKRLNLLDAVNNEGNSALDILVQAEIEEGIEYLSSSEFKRSLQHVVTQYPLRFNLIDILMQVFKAKFEEELAKTPGPLSFSRPVYNGVSETTLLHALAAEPDTDTEFYVIGLIRNRVNVLALDGRGDTVLHTLATLSITHSIREKHYISMARVILESYMRMVLSSIDTQTELEHARDCARVLYIALTRLIANKQGMSVITHAANIQAIGYLQFLLQFKLLISSSHEEDNYLEFAQDITAIEKLPTRWGIEQFHCLLTDMENYTDPVKYSSPGKLRNVSNSQVASVDHKQTSSFLLKTIVDLPEEDTDFEFDDALLDKCIKMLELDPLSEIVKGYCRTYFWFYRVLFCIHVLVMCFLTAPIVVFAYPGFSELDNLTSMKVTGVFVCAYSLIITNVRIYLTFDSWRQRDSEFSMWTVVAVLFSAMFTLTAVCWYLSLYVCNICQAYFYALCLAMGWTLTMSYIQAFKDLHVFINILKAIFRSNLFSFIVVFAFFALAYWCTICAIALYPSSQMSPSNISVRSNHSEPNETDIKRLGLWDLLYIAILFTTNMDGIFRDDELAMFNLADSGRKIFAQITCVLFAVVTAVILLNVLIAMMNDSYRRVVDREQSLWLIESLRHTIRLKRIFRCIFADKDISPTLKSKTIELHSDQTLKIFTVCIERSSGCETLVNEDVGQEAAAGDVLIRALASRDSEINKLRDQVSRLEAKLDLLLTTSPASRVIRKWKTFKR